MTFVTVMYGIGLPILFPICLLSYFIFYAVERYQVAYTYKLPPMMDATMTYNAIRLLKYMPILFLWNGYWMLSNRQIFENIINKVQFSTQEMESSHTISSTIWVMRPTTPMLLFCFVNMVIGILRTFIPDKLQ